MSLVQLNSFSKVVIVGTSGAGKTHLARAIAHKFNMPDIELDALYWEPHWTPSDPGAFQARVQSAMDDKGWVVHGNYSKVRDMIWNKADVIIWLDYPRRIVWSRLLLRTFQRAWTKQKVCGDNTESFRLSFFNKESILLWSIRTFNRNRKLYSSLMQDPHFGPKIIRLKTPAEAAQLLK